MVRFKDRIEVLEILLLVCGEEGKKCTSLVERLSPYSRS